MDLPPIDRRRVFRVPFREAVTFFALPFLAPIDLFALSRAAFLSALVAGNASLAESSRLGRLGDLAVVAAGGEGRTRIAYRSSSSSAPS